MQLNAPRADKPHDKPALISATVFVTECGFGETRSHSCLLPKVGTTEVALMFMNFVAKYIFRRSPTICHTHKLDQGATKFGLDVRSECSVRINGRPFQVRLRPAVPFCVSPSSLNEPRTSLYDETAFNYSNVETLMMRM